MTAYYIGGMSIGEAVPAAAAGFTLGVDGINLALPDIQARLQALQDAIAALATMPPLPSFPTMLAEANALLTSMQLAIATPGLPPPPSIASTIAALAALVSSLLAAVADVNAKLSAIAALQSLFATAGLHVFTFDGPRSNIGVDVQGEIDAHVPGSGSTGCWSFMIVTTSGATRDALIQVFKVDP